MIQIVSSRTVLLLSELIGTDLDFRKTRGSIFSRLLELTKDEKHSLDPSTALNSILTRLVSLLQGAWYHSLPTSSSSFAEVERAVCHAIDCDEVLRSRAEFIRDIAMQAEFCLEMYHVRCMLSKYLEESSISAIEKVSDASMGFPYITNYVEMVQKESCMLRKYLPKCRTDRHVSGDGDSSDVGCWMQTVAFCGSGPLPLTGILMAIYLKVKVALIECDKDAAELSKKLIQHWEKAKIIPAGVARVIHSRGEDLTYTNSMTAPRAISVQDHVPCQVLFLAALIPNEAKESMVAQIGALKEGGPLVVMRTAHGLTARFAYSQTRRDILTKHLRLIGVVVPEMHLDRNGCVVDDCERPIGYFPPDILNSLELYSW